MFFFSLAKRHRKSLGIFLFIFLTIKKRKNIFRCEARESIFYSEAWNFLRTHENQSTIKLAVFLSLLWIFFIDRIGFCSCFFFRFCCTHWLMYRWDHCYLWSSKRYWPRKTTESKKNLYNIRLTSTESTQSIWKTYRLLLLMCL